MKLQSITRDVIHTISRYSNWKPAGIEQSFREHGVYADRAKWLRFIDVCLLCLGIVFMVAGIIFFFAYNWQDMHKFLKLGLIQALLIAAIALVLFSKFDAFIKNCILCGASFLTGALFSVYGQIYQTGANAYDFFLGWTVFITLWAVVSRFAPLWLLLISLVDITILLYANQVARGWSAPLLFCILFVVNTGCLVGFMRFERLNIPRWFLKLLAISAVCWSTISIVAGIGTQYSQAWWISLAIVTVMYTAGIVYSFRSRTIFYLLIIPLSVIIIISAFLVDTGDQHLTSMSFIVSAFIVSSITVLITQLIRLNKTWNGE
ncbi:DUF2157 domain-containing protein [Arcticibacter tournemirensis]